MTDASSGSLRRLPRQDRSAQRLDLVLDTAAALIDEVGYNSLSITLIAKRAGISAPGVYRYFDDLESIARALAARNLTRYVASAERVLDEKILDWQDAMMSALSVFAELYRSEPGYRWLRFGDVIDGNLFSTQESNKTMLSRIIAEMFSVRYDVLPRPDLVKHVEVVLALADGLVTKAFEVDPDGDEFFINECKRLVIGYFTEYLARPVPGVHVDVDTAPEPEPLFTSATA
ncbi:TetR/AcrR family transcriptional regulator [Glaciihabitans sp. dw_435]|uniref:TetR/AcrR family transcriptional regulator n=1 Tax=Glaciihabitans sp. dw_435 TaxID=2720081 RepID=UPI001BD33E4B|nr:TetR/AcrR family transcriptional regulator [Glaciihabitans sp. dw_435]